MKRINRLLATLFLVTAPAAAFAVTPRTAAACWGCIEGTCAIGIEGDGPALSCIQLGPGFCKLVGTCVG